MFAYFRALLILMPLGLSGCGTAAQVESNRMRTEAVETNAATKDCYERVYAKPAFAQLQTKLCPATETTCPLQFLTDQTRPTKAEIAALYQLHADVQVCRKTQLDGFSRVHPQVLLVMVEAFSAKDKIGSRQPAGDLPGANLIRR